MTPGRAITASARERRANPDAVLLIREEKRNNERHGAQFVAITPARGYLFSIAMVSSPVAARNNFARRGSDG